MTEQPMDSRDGNNVNYDRRTEIRKLLKKLEEEPKTIPIVAIEVTDGYKDTKKLKQEEKVKQENIDTEPIIDRNTIPVVERNTIPITQIVMKLKEALFNATQELAAIQKELANIRAAKKDRKEVSTIKIKSK